MDTVTMKPVTSLTLLVLLVAVMTHQTCAKKHYFPGFTGLACKVTDVSTGDELKRVRQCPEGDSCSIGPLLVEITGTPALEVMFCNTVDSNGQLTLVDSSCRAEISANDTILLDYKVKDCDLGPLTVTLDGMAVDLYFSVRKFAPYASKHLQKGKGKQGGKSKGSSSSKESKEEEGDEGSKN